MLDIHAHFLPAIDDGAGSFSEAVDILKLLVADGVRHVVATPHVFPGKFDNLRSDIAESWSSFQHKIEALDLPLTSQYAGEVRLSEHLPDLLTREELPFLGVFEGYQILLLELPDGQIPLGADKLVRWLVANGVRPLLAHPERNRQVREGAESIYPFVELGCLLQLTAGSLLGHFGPRTLRTARALLDRGKVAAIASDTHNAGARKPCMSAAFAWLEQNYGLDVASQLTFTGPAALCGYDPEHWRIQQA